MDKRQHARTKLILKIVGFTLIVLGATLAIVGLANFFSSVNKDEMPSLFWCTFAGMPVLMIGICITIFGFKREITTYIKNESVPVLNEASHELMPAIENVTDAVKDALEGEDIVCECGTANERGSEYCKHCGKPLSKVCPTCGTKVDGDSHYCNNCGTKLD